MESKTTDLLFLSFPLLIFCLFRIYFHPWTNEVMEIPVTVFLEEKHSKWHESLSHVRQRHIHNQLRPCHHRQTHTLVLLLLWGHFKWYIISVMAFTLNQSPGLNITWKWALNLNVLITQSVLTRIMCCTGPHKYSKITNTNTLRSSQDNLKIAVITANQYCQWNGFLHCQRSRF